jgi:hypothetical protein
MTESIIKTDYYLFPFKIFGFGYLGIAKDTIHETKFNLERIVGRNHVTGQIYVFENGGTTHKNKTKWRTVFLRKRPTS